MSFTQTENRKFLEKLRTSSVEMEDNINRFAQKTLNETCFSRKILPAEFIEPSACQRSTLHDGLCKIIDVEPDSTPLIYESCSGLLKSGDTKYIVYPKAQVDFIKVQSPVIEKDVYELMSYEIPMAKIIDDNLVRPIAESIDQFFLNMSRKATQLTGNIIVRDMDKFNPADLKDLCGLTDKNGIPSAQLLSGTLFKNHVAAHIAESEMYKPDDKEMTDLEKANLKAQCLINGYEYNKLLGRQWTVSNKNDMFFNNVFVYGRPNMLGVSYILKDIEVCVEQRFGKLQMQAYTIIGMCISNIKAIGRMGPDREEMPDSPTFGLEPMCPPAMKEAEPIKPVKPVDEYSIETSPSY